MKKEELIEIIKKNDLTHKKLADMIGFHPNAISMWVTGRRKIRPSTEKLIRHKLLM